MITCHYFTWDTNIGIYNFPYTFGQILEKLRTDSSFFLEANLKSLYQRSSQSLILKTPNHDQSKHDYKPGSNFFKYHHSYTNTNSCYTFFTKIQKRIMKNLISIRACIYKSAKDEAQIVKANF